MPEPRIYRSLADVPPDFGPCVTTIGNFDGVHFGHQSIMRRVVDTARARGLQAAVLTFNPHPAKIVAPDRAPKLIMDHDRRAGIMGDLGIDIVLMLPFTHELSRLNPEAFVKSVLSDAMQVRVVFVGEDFRFAHKQSGDTNILRTLGEKYGFEVDPISPVEVRGERASSSLVREMAQAGRINRACRLLARPFELEGAVVKGHGIGASQTVPTLNLAPDTEVFPANGVYATRTLDLLSGRRWNSITNVGTRPTFDGADLSIETFLLEPMGEIQPTRLRIEFLWRIRDERKFPSAAALKAQIAKDVAVAQEYQLRIGRLLGRNARAAVRCPQPVLVAR